ncbi:MAG: hypothetical protein QXD24_04355 [Candidatus Caldarchaeum sp.]
MGETESTTAHRRVSYESSTKHGKTYCTVKIPAALAEAIDSYLMEHEAQVRGLKSRADVVVRVLTEFLEEQGRLRPLVKRRLEHVNVYESFVLVRDNLLNVSVEVAVQPPRLFCRYCVSGECVHVSFAASIPDVRRRFAELGFRAPETGEDVGGYVVFFDGVAYPYTE